MDEHLKRRLIGATVLVSLAVIFIPMLLDKEPVIDRGITETNIPPEPVRRYKPLPLPEKKPVIEPVVKLKLADEMELQGQPAEDPKKNVSAITPFPAEKTEVAQQTHTTGKETKKTQKTEKPVTGISAWVIQVIAFSKQVDAQELVETLKKQRYAAFVEPANAKGKTLYRVLVGPEADKTVAERKLKRLNNDLKSKKIKGYLKRYP